MFGGPSVDDELFWGSPALMGKTRRPYDLLIGTTNCEAKYVETPTSDYQTCYEVSYP